MADIKAIRDRLKTRLAAVSGLRAYDIVPDTVALPAAVVMPSGEFSNDVTMDGCLDLEFVVLVLVQSISDRSSQDALDTYASSAVAATDIAAAIDSGSTADWDYAITGPFRNYGETTWGDSATGQKYLGFEIPVSVAAR